MLIPLLVGRLKLQPVWEFGNGIIPVLRICWLVAETGTNNCACPATLGQSGYKLRSMVWVPGGGQTSEKFAHMLPTAQLFTFRPAPVISVRSASVGTAWLNSCGVFSSRNSSDQKKNVLSFFVLYTPGMKIGPP